MQAHARAGQVDVQGGGGRAAATGAGGRRRCRLRACMSIIARRTGHRAARIARCSGKSCGAAWRWKMQESSDWVRSEAGCGGHGELPSCGGGALGCVGAACALGATSRAGEASSDSADGTCTTGAACGPSTTAQSAVAAPSAPRSRASATLVRAASTATVCRAPAAIAWQGARRGVGSAPASYGSSWLRGRQRGARSRRRTITAWPCSASTGAACST